MQLVVSSDPTDVVMKTSLSVLSHFAMLQLRRAIVASIDIRQTISQRRVLLAFMVLAIL